MSSEKNIKKDDEENNLALTSNNLTEENIQKEPHNKPQNKNETQFPSSTIASTPNQDLMKADTNKLGQIMPDFLNNNSNSNKFNYFQSKKLDSSDINSNDKNNDESDKICCFCSKTRCIKKYCECFSNKRFCKNCHCVNCLNKSIHLGNEIQKESNEINQIFCTCTKSNCNKKYCDCFKSNIKCTSRCRCINCKNCNKHSSFNFQVTSVKSEENINIINNSSNNINNNLKVNDINSNDVNNSIDNLGDDNKSEIINLEEKGDDERNNSNKSYSRRSSLDSKDSFQIQRVSVCINKFETIIDVEKFTKEMMFIAKKRKKNLK